MNLLSHPGQIFQSTQNPYKALIFIQRQNVSDTKATKDEECKVIKTKDRKVGTNLVEFDESFDINMFPYFVQHPLLSQYVREFLQAQPAILSQTLNQKQTSMFIK